MSEQIWQVFRVGQGVTIHKAIKKLEDRKREVWVPFENRPKRLSHQRRHNVVSKELLPGFLFVKEFEWKSRLEMLELRPFAKELFLHGNQITVKDHELDPLRQACQTRSLETSGMVDDQGFRIEIGDAVLVLQGPFIDRIGKVTSRRKVHLEVEVPGFQLKFLIAPFLLRKIQA